MLYTVIHFQQVFYRQMQSIMSKIFNKKMNYFFCETHHHPENSSHFFCLSDVWNWLLYIVSLHLATHIASQCIISMKIKPEILKTTFQWSHNFCPFLKNEPILPHLCRKLGDVSYLFVVIDEVQYVPHCFQVNLYPLYLINTRKLQICTT